MKRVIGVLFPWRAMFRRLELEKRWWHRLAVVLLFIALVPVFLFSWVLGDDANGPVLSLEGEIQHWEILPAIPAGANWESIVDPVTRPPDANSIGKGKIAAPLKDTFAVVAARVKPSEMLKTIEMPDGTTVTYPGTTSDEIINGEWRKKHNIATTKAALLGFGIAVLVTLMLSYLLQSMYRAALYVIYGAKSKSAIAG